MKQKKALKLFARTRTGPQLPTIGVKEAIAIFNRTSICDAMLGRLEMRDIAILPVMRTDPYTWRQEQYPYRPLDEVRSVVPHPRWASFGHVNAFRAWRAGWIRAINKHRPSRNERRAARKTLATKEN